MKHTCFKEASLNELFFFVDENQKEIIQAQELIHSKTKRHYPLMKILDMYFWQVGYEAEQKKAKDRVK